jgi:hypothetical protein
MHVHVMFVARSYARFKQVLELQAPALPEGAIAPSQTRTELLRYSPPPLPSLLSLTDLHDDIDGISALESSAEEPPRGDGSPACPASARWIPSESPEEIAPDEILKLNIADSDVAHEPGATSLAWTSKEMNGDGAPSDESRSAAEGQHADRDEPGAGCASYTPRIRALSFSCHQQYMRVVAVSSCSQL